MSEVKFKRFTKKAILNVNVGKCENNLTFINFFCHKYNLLKQAHKFPKLDTPICLNRQ